MFLNEAQNQPIIDAFLACNDAQRGAIIPSLSTVYKLVGKLIPWSRYITHIHRQGNPICHLRQWDQL